MLSIAASTAAMAERCGKSGVAASGGTGTAQNGEAAGAAVISGQVVGSGAVQSGWSGRFIWFWFEEGRVGPFYPQF